MKTIGTLIALLLLTAGPAPAEPARTYIGVVTDTMCATNHAAMKVTPESQCVKVCVGQGTRYKYALVVGKALYTLSDQETPGRFAGRKVKVSGVLYTKTNILKVDSIAPAN